MKDGIVESLSRIVGTENVKSDPADLFVYGSDASVHTSPPWVIVKPHAVEEVQDILRYANENRIPVTPRGAGSGMSGQAVPVDGGIVLDMKGFNRILEVRVEDTFVRVEAGVIDDDLNRALKPYGFSYPPAPASSRIATIGGEIANNASGLRSVKYGATRDSVLGMKVVLADGSLITLGATTRVEATGYQLDRLMVGSEGTLGVIVEATLKIVPIPKFRCMGIACFDKLTQAGITVSKIIGSGSSPSMLELMDDIAITAVNKTMELGLPEVEAILFFEADGKVRESVDIEMKQMKDICEENGAFDVKMTYDAKERAKLFLARKKLFASLSRYQEGLSCTSLADDMAVPYSRMAETANKIHEIAKRNNVIMTAYGHCGSGVIHTKILMDTTMDDQWHNAENAVREVYEFVRSVGGTTSAEHGIGISKAPAWKKEKADSLEILRAVKRAFDPNNILNPQKMQDASDNWLTATDLRYTVGDSKMQTTYLQEWKDELNTCIRCGYCFEGCPVFKDLNWELDGARGKVILAYGLLSGNLEPSEYIAEKLYQCTYCKDCVERCSANISVPSIMTAARADLKEAGFTYDSHAELLDKITRTGNIFGKDLKAPGMEGEVPVLLGCRFVERRDDAEKYLDMLRRLGINPTVVEDEICCGMPFAVLGYKKELAEHKKKFKEIFQHKKFICLCTSCAFFISESYPELEPVYVIEEIHRRLPDADLAELGVKTTYHDPCNVCRGMKMVDEPRDIIGWLGAELVEMPTNRMQAECCGGGGGVLVTDKALASRLAEKRIRQADELDVSSLVTLCPTCEVNLKNAAESTGSNMKVRNLFDLVCDALK